MMKKAMSTTTILVELCGCWSAHEKGGRQKTLDDGNSLVHVKNNEWLRKNILTMVSTIAHAQAFFIIIK